MPLKNFSEFLQELEGYIYGQEQKSRDTNKMSWPKKFRKFLIYHFTEATKDQHEKTKRLAYIEEGGFTLYLALAMQDAIKKSQYQFDEYQRRPGTTSFKNLMNSIYPRVKDTRHYDSIKEKVAVMDSFKLYIIEKIIDQDLNALESYKTYKQNRNTEHLYKVILDLAHRHSILINNVGINSNALILSVAKYILNKACWEARNPGLIFYKPYIFLYSAYLNMMSSEAATKSSRRHSLANAESPEIHPASPKQNYLGLTPRHKGPNSSPNTPRESQEKIAPPRSPRQQGHTPRDTPSSKLQQNIARMDTLKLTPTDNKINDAKESEEKLNSSIPAPPEWLDPKKNKIIFVSAKYTHECCREELSLNLNELPTTWRIFKGRFFNPLYIIDAAGDLIFNNAAKGYCTLTNYLVDKCYKKERNKQNAGKRAAIQTVVSIPAMTLMTANLASFFIGKVGNVAQTFCINPLYSSLQDSAVTRILPPLIVEEDKDTEPVEIKIEKPAEDQSSINPMHTLLQGLVALNENQARKTENINIPKLPQLSYYPDHNFLGAPLRTESLNTIDEEKKKEKKIPGVYISSFDLDAIPGQVNSPK